MASSRLFNNIGKILRQYFISIEEFSVLGRIGIGLAIAGGVINSMLYNGKYEKIKKKTCFL